MSKNIKVALLGLGEVGQAFAENFLEAIQENGKPIEIVAVAHDQLDCPIVLGFQQNGVPVYENAVDVVELGDGVDVIFDLTGNAETRRALRQGLMNSNNNHTVVAPEIMAKLLWMFFDGDMEIDTDNIGGY